MSILNTQNFLKLFSNYELAGYEHPTILTDTKIGFSIQRKYPESIGFKPAKTNKGEHDNIAAIWVVYDEKLKTKHLVPIRVRAALMSKYRIKNYDYDFSDENCPSEESIIQSKKSIQPLEVNLVGSFFYDTINGTLVDDANKIISGVVLLNKVYDYHCRTSLPIKGLSLRLQRKIPLAILKIFDLIVKILEFILKEIFGRTLGESLEKMTYFDGYSKENFKKLPGDYLEIAKYKASNRVIILHITIVVIICLWIIPVKEKTYWETIIHSEFLIAIHNLVLLIFLDEILPNLIFRLLNKTIYIRKIYLDKSLRF